MPGRWTRKPPYGTPIDRSHPLSQGLRCFFALNEPSGTVVRDAVAGLAANTFDHTSPAGLWARTPWGAALSFVGNDQGATTASIAGTGAAIASVPVTIAFGVAWTGSVVATSNLFGIYTNLGTSATFIELNPASSSSLTLSCNAGTSSKTLACSTIATGVPRVFAVDLTADNPTQTNFYDQGKLAVSSAFGGTVGAPSYGASSGYAIGANATSGIFAQNAEILWAASWNRLLSPAEHFAIGASIESVWRMFRPRHDTLFIFGAAAGGASCVGAMGVTLAGATFAGSGNTSTPASMALTLGADTFAGSASTATSAALAATLAPATFAGSASFTATAALAVTLAGDTFAGSASLATSAAMAATLGADTFTGSASGGGTGGGPWVLVESLKVETGSTTGPVTGTFVSAVASGDLVVVSASLYTTTTQGTVTITDNAAGGSNTYTEAARSAVNGGNWAAIDYSVVARGGSGFAVTLNFSVAQFTGISFLHYTNTGTPITFDAGNAQTGTGATGSAPVVAAGAGELAIGQLATALAGLTYTPGSGFAVEQSGVLGTHEPFATIDDLSSPSGTVMPSVGISTPGNWAFASALFRVPTAGASAAMGVTLSAATFAGSVTGPASAAMAVTLAPAIFVGAGVGGVVSISVVDPSAGTLIEPAAAPQSAPAPIATTFAIRWYMTLASDHSSPSAVTPTVLLCGPGSGWFTPAGALSYLGAGEWEIAATAPDQSRGWPLILWATAADADGQPGWYAPPGWGWPQGVTAASLPVWLGTAASGGWLPAEGVLPTWVFTRPEGGPSAAGTGTFARPAGVGRPTYGWSWYYPSAADVAAAGELAIRAGATGAVDWTATYPIAATGLVVLPAPPPPPAATGGGSQVDPSEGTVIII